MTKKGTIANWTDQDVNVFAVVTAPASAQFPEQITGSAFNGGNIFANGALNINSSPVINPFDGSQTLRKRSPGSAVPNTADGSMIHNVGFTLMSNTIVGGGDNYGLYFYPSTQITPPTDINNPVQGVTQSTPPFPYNSNGNYNNQVPWI